MATKKKQTAAGKLRKAEKRGDPQVIIRKIPRDGQRGDPQVIIRKTPKA